MGYDVLVIDPPWQVKKGGLRSVRPHQGRLLDYQVMCAEWTFNLLDQEIFPLASTAHSVFLWTVDKFLGKAEELMQYRGYKRHARLVWDKMNGIAPAFTVRYSHEYLIWFYKPKLPRIANDARGRFCTVFREPARQHSRKPDYAYSLVRTLYPMSKAIDVFSREKRDGWDQWGNECAKFSNDVRDR